MSNVTEVDRLVVRDEALAARLWPRLGPRVRRTFLADRDKWIALHQQVAAGAVLPAKVLNAERGVFAGWLTAFQAAARPARTAGPPSAAPAATEPTTAHTAPVAPPLAAVSTGISGAGGAVAGGLVLAGLIAVAAKRKRP